MALPTIAIIVLNYNSREDTLDCLRSLELLTYSRAYTIVVDNDSSDGSVESIRSQFPQIKLIETGANLGFTGGNNIGIRHALEAGADFVMLLNNDTIVAPDLIDQMVTAMVQDPKIGVAGPTIYYYEQPHVVWSAGGDIDWKRGTTSMTAIGSEDKGQFGTEAREVQFVTGCALLARREVWETVGLLDEQFFMYYEETEWCVRASRAGYKIVHVPQAMLWHKISIEARATSPLTHYYMVRNRLLFLHDTQAGLGSWLYTLSEYGRSLISWTLRPRWRDRRHLRAVTLRAIKDYSLGNFGQTTI